MTSENVYEILDMSNHDVGHYFLVSFATIDKAMPFIPRVLKLDGNKITLKNLNQISERFSKNVVVTSISYLGYMSSKEFLH